MKIVDVFKADLKESTDSMGLESQPVVEINKSNIAGGYATTVALAGAKSLKQAPIKIAEVIKAHLDKKDYYETVEIVKPGFINVTFKPEFLSQVLVNIDDEKENYGQNPVKDYIYNVEEVSANPTGWLHIGHARNAVFGDSLTRILKKDGYPTQTEYYTNDAGNQINILAVTVFVHYLNLLGIKAEKPEGAYAGDAYNDVAQKFIDEYGDKFKDVKFNDKQILDEEVHQLFRVRATRHFLKIIKTQLADLDVHIGHYSSEQEMYDKHEIEKLIALYEEKGALFQKEGATWLRTTDFGDDKDRVLIKSDGSYTYIVPDLATHHIRVQRTNADKYINIWGGDHHGYIPRLRAGLALLGNDREILDIETVQMVRLIKDGQEYKMSKRKGTAVWLIDILEMVGKDSLRYMLASKSPSSHMDLDLDLIQQKNSSNPVYYAQYATARANSVLRQAKNKSLEPLWSQTSLLNQPRELALLATLDNFSEVIHSASKNRAPQLVTDYIQQLAKQFHSYYADAQIIDDTNPALSQARLGLVAATLQVLTNAFDLIGVSPKEKM
ncbi:arginyl-tRNA synthetase [Entomoplasma freundtii]|uniref:Arginine--tRNA ligase n=1 Tax=Entomoplasma freundtii TaxID=74700 RepID=A0A2K8NRR0_9MOLU|nr:arginine--tRNA ligase [Entomoplasma freundtii]ATZ16542.1 arginyl-tRNA synthetase [Entomoplasma freundtii]TDY58292.1 arginyl-tRNA synthetase [Entomoplasma freundtii]